MIESFKLPNITPEAITGSICSFNDEYGGLPLKSCTSLISGYQEGSGTPSPDNVRPLHAFSSATLTANSNTYTFTFGQSIYQGYIDWKRGVVVGTWGLLDLGTLNWSMGNRNYADTGYIFYSQSSRFVPSSSFICSIFNDVGYYPHWESININEGLIYRSAIPFLVLCSIETSASSFKTAMDGVQLAYELATPIEIPLGGINLLTQEGQNNIYADCGDTEVQRLKVN